MLMRATRGVVFGVGLVVAGGVFAAQEPLDAGVPVRTTVLRPTIGARGIETAALTAVVQRYCQNCHNARLLRGNVDLEGYDVDSAAVDVALTEKMIRKLRNGMMPPPTSRKPGGDTLVALVETLEQVVDAASKPNPGSRTFQRLNRPEYEAAVRDLLGVAINAADFLPLDTKSANFDNIADVARVLPQRSVRGEPHCGWRPRRGSDSRHLPGIAVRVAASARPRPGRAVRHARRHRGNARVPGGWAV
jgi:hypothetical protein